MTGIKIYKSINNGLGGDIDTTASNIVFSNKDFGSYCCVYIRNESVTPLTILNIKIISLDFIQLGLVKNEEGTPLLDTLGSIEIAEELIYNSHLSFDSLVLPPNSFFNIWLKVSKSTYYNHKRNINLNVEYISEY